MAALLLLAALVLLLGAALRWGLDGSDARWKA
jgi:hypothetical protein